MQKKKMKIVALVLATAMVMAPATAFAADTTSTTSPVSDSAIGVGSNEGTVDREVFSVVLPSAADNTSTFNFILDPEGLIAESTTNNGAKSTYQGKAFEANQTLFFATPNSKSTTNYDYASTSDKLKVINVGTTKVDVTLTATAQNVTGGAVFTDDATATGSATSIYIALNADGVTTPSAINAETNTAALTTTIDAVADTCYLVKAKGDGTGYELVQKSDFDRDVDGKKLEFWLTGHCNSDAKWTGEEKANVEVVWSLKKAALSLTATEAAIPTPDASGWEGNSIWIDLADSGTITAVTISADGAAQTAITDYEVQGTWVGLDFDKESLSPYATVGTLSVWVQIGSKVYTCKLW